MESSYWARFAALVKRCHTDHIKETFGGYCMGFIGAQHILYSGVLSNMVGPVWWAIKGIGTIVLAFGSSLATGYAGVIIAEWKENRQEKRAEKKKKKVA